MEIKALSNQNFAALIRNIVLKLIIILFTFISPIHTKAQTMSQNIAGEYYLTGVPETASGFRLGADSTFDFFFSQGALDRYGSGKWSVKNNMLVLNSRTWPGKDFALIKAAKLNGSSVTIKIVDENSILFHYMDCTVKNGAKEFTGTTNDEGIATFAAPGADSLILQFRFCPERLSVFPLRDKTLNYFEFNIEKWLTEFFFENLTLKIDKDQLLGSNPMLEGKSFKYEKKQ